MTESSLHDALERERDRFRMPDDALDRLTRYRDRKRRNQRLLSGLVALVVFAAGSLGLAALLRGGHRGPSPATTTPPAHALAHLPSLSAISFVDPAHGWAAGMGSIVATTDGGRTWIRQFATGDRRASFTQLDFVDPLHGWAVAPVTAAPGELLRTTDGGSHWTPAAEPTSTIGPLRQIDFIDASDGWAVAGGVAGTPYSGTLVHTTDGGLTWTKVTTQAPGVDSVCFADAQSGWVTAGSSFQGTQDGGQTWDTPPHSSFTVPGEPNMIGSLGCSGRGVYGLFPGGAAASHQAYVVRRSVDSGASWAFVAAASILQPGDPELRGLPQIDAYSGPFQVLDDQTVSFLGTCEPCGAGSTSILQTMSGGSTFTRAKVLGPGAPGGIGVAVSFADPLHGWVVARSPVSGGQLILATSDGGRTWQQLYPRA